MAEKKTSMATQSSEKKQKMEGQRIGVHLCNHEREKMKVGDLVHYNNHMFGVIVELDPFKDGLHTTIFWTDEHEPGGSIESVWLNEDFEVIK